MGDLYTVNVGGWVKTKSRRKSAEDMARGREKKDREDPEWRKRCHVSPEWSAEDRQEQSRKMKEVWTKPELDALKEKARERAIKLRAEGKLGTGTIAKREADRERMSTLWRYVISHRKIFQPEAVAQREQRNREIAHAFYVRGMRAKEIAQQFALEVSFVYRIIRETPLV